MEYDSAPLKVLFIGGTGRISTSSVKLAVASGMNVTVLNRGTSKFAVSPPGVEHLVCDISNPDDLSLALGGRHFDSVIDFLSFNEAHAARMVRLFGPLTRQYIHISSASIYSKPVQQLPITETTPVGPNEPLPYATEKWRTEVVLQQAHRDTGFPLTIVRPSHTYDDARIPLPGEWTIVDRLLRGAEIPVHGDGTSLWTLTHAEDFAQGLVGLIGNSRTIGETFNITGQDVFTWDQIYTIFATALSVTPKLVHVASEMFPIVAPDWFWSGEFVGDLGHSAIFDTTKLKRFVPGFSPKLTLERSVHRMLAWREANPELAKGEVEMEAILDRVVEAYHAGRQSFEKLAIGKEEGARS